LPYKDPEEEQVAKPSQVAILYTVGYTEETWEIYGTLSLIEIKTVSPPISLS